MASSIFNSEEPQPPHAPWGRTILLAAALIAAGIAGFEALSRHWGFRPTLLDDADLWCTVRAQVREDDPNQIVLVGTSRMEMDIDPAALADALGTAAPLQLSVAGSSSIPVLKHFAEQTEFAGTLICDVFYGNYFHLGNFDVGKQQLFVEHWQSRPAVSSLERDLTTRVQSSFTLRLPTSCQDENGHRWYLTGHKPAPPFVEVLPDRSIIGNFSRVKITAVRATQREYLVPCAQRPISAAELQDNFGRIESWTRQVQARGGRVVFLRLPVSAEMWAAEEAVFPRRQFWDEFARSSSGICLQSADDGALARFDCPDGSHLDGADRAAYSRALGEVLRPLMSAKPKSPSGN